MACLLAIFKFSNARDENDSEIEIESRWKAGLVVYVFF
jgi:hypothetical protein